MSSIKHLSIRGLKVAEMDVDLARLNLVVGRVGSGKSSVVDAIQFGALGAVPRVGLSNALTAKLVRGAEAEVSLTFEHKDSEQSFTRRLFRDGDAWKQSASASWVPPRTKTDEVSEMITRCFGATDTEAAQNLDITRLLSASSGELAATVEKLLDSAGMSPDAIDAEVRRIFCGRLETLRPNVDGIIGPIPAAVSSVANSILGQLVERARRSIAEAILWGKDRKNAAAAEERESQSAAKTAKTRLADLKAPAEASADLRTRRQAAHARAEEIGTTLKLYRQGAAARATAKTEVDRARSAAAQAEEVLKIRKEAAAKVHTLRAEIEALRNPAAPVAPALFTVDQEALAKEIQPHVYQLDQMLEREPKHPAAPVLLAAIEADIDAVCGAGTYARWLELNVESKRRHEKARELGDRPLPEIPAIDVETRTLRAAERDLAAADQSPWREVVEIADHIDRETESEVDGLPHHPWHEKTDRLRALASANGCNRSTLEGAVIRAKEALAQARLLREAAQEERIAAANTLKKFAEDATAASDENARFHAKFTAAIEAENTKRRDSIAPTMAAYHEAREAYGTEQRRLQTLIQLAKHDAAAAAEKANREAQTAHAAAVRLFEAACTAVDAERNAKLAEVQRLEQDERVATRIATDAQKALAAAEAAIAGSAEALTIDEAALEAEQNGLIAKLDQLDAQLSVVGRAEALREELARFVASAETAAAVRDVYAAAEWALTRVRDEDLRTRAGALEGPMRRFLAPVPDAGEPMVRAEKGKVQLGLRYGERFVDAAALSGGQAALFRAALGFAQIVARAPVLRVLHIELAEACDGVLEDQILRACEAVSEEVQVVVTTCVPIAEPDAGRGWNVIRVEREAATTAA